MKIIITNQEQYLINSSVILHWWIRLAMSKIPIYEVFKIQLIPGKIIVTFVSFIFK